MNTFVTACRREWRRLGVPEAVANEMASDLQTDLAEAEADGVSPEEVLGNGYLDPQSFAASWATARGVTDAPSRPAGITRRRPRTEVTAAVICGVAVLAGLFVVAASRRSSATVAGVAIRRSGAFKMPSVPGVFVEPQTIFIARHSPQFALFGAGLFLAGLLGLAVILWLGRPWTRRGRRTDGTPGPSPDRDIGMPSYL